MKRSHSCALLFLACVLAIACRMREEPRFSVFSEDAGFRDTGSDAALDDGPSTPRTDAGSIPASNGNATAGKGSVGPTGGMRASGSGAAGRASAGGRALAGRASAGTPAAGAANGGEGCSPTVAGCNPVTNEGCPDATQCVPDLLANPVAGYCTFTAPLDGGAVECFNSGVTESCPPRSTCVNGACRTLCFCDADCSDAQCCNEQLGAVELRLCGDC